MKIKLAFILLLLSALPVFPQMELDTLWTWESKYTVNTKAAFFAPDDSLIIHLKSNEERIYVRDALTGDSLRSAKIGNWQINHMIMSRDGEHIFVAGNDEYGKIYKLRLSDLSIVKEYKYTFPDTIYYPSEPSIINLVSTNDGKKIIANYFIGYIDVRAKEAVSAIIVWNTETDSAEHLFYDGKYYGYMAHSPVDTILALMETEYPEGIVLYNSNTFERIRVLDSSSMIGYEMTFSPDGQFLAAGSEREEGVGYGVSVWKVSTGEVYRRLFQDYGECSVWKVQFFNNSDYLFSSGNISSEDFDSSFLSIIWQLSTKKRIYAFPKTSGHALAISNDDSLFFLDSAGKVFMYRVKFEDGIKYKSEDIFKIYPNPSDDIIFFDFRSAGVELNSEIEIYNSLGAKVSDETYTYRLNRANVEINISSFPKGVYFVMVRTGSEWISGSFVKR